MYTKCSVSFVLLIVGAVKIVSGNSMISRIVGGDAALDEYGKFHASIQNLTGYHICGGAVVSELHVVTAAHCVYGVNPSYMKIVTGTNNLSSGGQQHDVAAIVVYNNYNKTTNENDIALIKVKRLFDLRYIKILKLSKKELVEGDEILLSGFGAEVPNGSNNCIMQSLNVTVFNQETCKYAMRYSSRLVTKKMFCTFSKIGEGTCHGDSGSPVIKGNELVGIVSWGIPCALGFPDVHTRISSYIGWIKKYIEESYCVPRKNTRINNIPVKIQRVNYVIKHMTIPINLTRCNGQIAFYKKKKYSLPVSLSFRSVWCFWNF